MIAAIGPDGSLAFYVALGMVATVNPCGFPLLPAYLSYFLGLEAGGANPSRHEDRIAGTRPGVFQAFRVGLAVSAGFLAVFAAAGAAVELTSLPVYENTPWVSLAIGVALLGLGVAMLFGFEPIVRLPKLERGGRTRTVPSMFAFGVSYAIASIGCTLPIFLGAVAGTMSRESVADGLIVFVYYAAGMTLVLLALTVAIALARTSLVRFLRNAPRYIGRISGGLVVLAGAYLTYYAWLELRTFRGTGRIPSSGITDIVSGWSQDIGEWVADTGAVRIGVVLALVLVGLGLAVRAHAPAAPPNSNVRLAERGGRRDSAQGARRSMRQPDGADVSRR